MPWRAETALIYNARIPDEEELFSLYIFRSQPEGWYEAHLWMSRPGTSDWIFLQGTRSYTIGDALRRLHAVLPEIEWPLGLAPVEGAQAIVEQARAHLQGRSAETAFSLAVRARERAETGHITGELLSRLDIDVDRQEVTLEFRGGDSIRLPVGDNAEVNWHRQPPPPPGRLLYEPPTGRDALREHLGLDGGSIRRALQDYRIPDLHGRRFISVSDAEADAAPDISQVVNEANVDLAQERVAPAVEAITGPVLTPQDLDELAEEARMRRRRGGAVTYGRLPVPRGAVYMVVEAAYSDGGPVFHTTFSAAQLRVLGIGGMNRNHARFGHSQAVVTVTRRGGMYVDLSIAGALNTPRITAMAWEMEEGHFVPGIGDFRTPPERRVNPMGNYMAPPEEEEDDGAWVPYPASNR